MYVFFHVCLLLVNLHLMTTTCAHVMYYNRNISMSNSNLNTLFSTDLFFYFLFCSVTGNFEVMIVYKNESTLIHSKRSGRVGKATTSRERQMIVDQIREALEGV